MINKYRKGEINMRKIIASVFSILLCFSFILGASAEYTIGENGDAKADTAIGYTFRIDKVNKSITGEDSCVFTTDEALKNAGSVWAVYFIAQKVQGNVYTVVGDAVSLTGNPHDAKLSEGQVAFFFHSATSNPDNAAEYPNWEDRITAIAVKDGNYLVLKGVDLDAETVNNGTLTVYADKDSAASADETGVGESSAEVAESSDAAAESSDEAESSSDESVVSQPAAESSAAESIPGIKTTEAPIGGGFPWLWVLSGTALVIVVIVVIIIVRKKK